LAIKLEVKDYCSECCDFEPDVTKPERLYCGDSIIFKTDTVVRCEYARRCENIKRYLEKKACKED